MKLHFTVLGSGTSQGVPVIGCGCKVCTSVDVLDKRLRTSLLVQSEHTTICIDAGPDFRQQMLNSGVKQLDAIVFTHEHMDHTAGLDDVRAFNYSQKKPMLLYCTEQVEKRLREQYSYIFNNPNYPGIPQIQFVRLKNKAFSVGEIDINPIKALHAQLEVYGFRFKELTYLTDANKISQEEKEKIKGAAYFIVNALRREPHHSHFNLQEAISLGHELEVEQTFLTHISHQMGLHKEVEQELPQGVNLAFDGLEISV